MAILIRDYFNYMGLQLIENPVSTEPPLSFQSCHHLGYLKIVCKIFFHLYSSEQVGAFEQIGNWVDYKQELDLHPPQEPGDSLCVGHFVSEEDEGRRKLRSGQDQLHGPLTHVVIQPHAQRVHTRFNAPQLSS